MTSSGITNLRFRSSKLHSPVSSRNAAPGAKTPPSVTSTSKYHDEEWGVPVHDDHTLFEFLILEGAQAGLSWSTILVKRKTTARRLPGSIPQKVARFTPEKIEKLLQDPGIVRNRLKVSAAVINAKPSSPCKGPAASTDTSGRLWAVNPRQQTGVHEGRARQHAESDAMSRDLKKRGFKFIGTTICYAFMQATGMVSDHVVDCFRYRKD